MTKFDALLDIAAMKTLKALIEYGRRWAYELSMLPDVDDVREAFRNRKEELK